MNKIVETYSRLADEYRRDEESQSCWYLAAEKASAAIELKDRYRTVADIGCGTGRALCELASRGGDDRRFIGVEPADNMRALAVEEHRLSLQHLGLSLDDEPHPVGGGGGASAEGRRRHGSVLHRPQQRP